MLTQCGQSGGKDAAAKPEAIEQRGGKK